MGQTIPGGYYRGVDGKFRNANGEEVTGGEGEKWASERTKAHLRQAEKEHNRPAKEIFEESKEKDEAEAPVTEGAATKTDPSTLGPAVMPDPKQASKAVEKSDSMPGVPGGKSGRK